MVLRSLKRSAIVGGGEKIEVEWEKEIFSGKFIGIFSGKFLERSG